MADCTLELENLNQTYYDLQNKYDECGCGIDPCTVTVATADYNKSLHVAAIFIILVCSFLGCGLPLLGKYFPRTKINPFIIILGKCMGMGIVLACALVHMLQPGNESLSSVCLPFEFNTTYTAFAYLYAMLGAIFMHFLDFCMLHYIAKQQKLKDTLEKERENGGQEQSEQEMSVKKMKEEEEEEKAILAADPHMLVHSVLLDPRVQRTIRLYALQFALTVHSVFIGLTTGVAGQSEVRALLVALCFHQFFEGIALGSRIVDTNLKSHAQEALMVFVFSISSPVGIAIGIALSLSLDPNGENFLFVQGTFDSVCAGFLLYIGFNLLLRDFPEDMGKYCFRKKYENLMIFGMFGALWLGAGLMAYIGQYL